MWVGSQNYLEAVGSVVGVVAVGVKPVGAGFAAGAEFAAGAAGAETAAVVDVDAGSDVQIEKEGEMSWREGLRLL